MKIHLKKMIVFLSLLLVFSTQSVWADNTVTLVGELIDDFQFITDDGLVFEIGETPKGIELLENIGDQRVRVTGTLQKTDDLLVIYIERYEIVQRPVPEKPGQ